MTYLRAAVTQVLKLFVADWTQAVGIIAIVAIGIVVTRRIDHPALGYAIAGTLAAHLVYGAIVEGRRLQRRAGMSAERRN